MLFKIASRVLPAGEAAPVNTSDPDELKMYAMTGAKISIGEIKIYKLRDKIPGGKIRSRYETKDPEQVRLLMKVPSLDFNPQEAVDEGILTYEEVKGMGWSVVAPAKPVEVAPSSGKLPEPLPDFDTMKKDVLVEWALGQTPPIGLDVRKRKDEMKADLIAELERRKEK